MNALDEAQTDFPEICHSGTISRLFHRDEDPSPPQCGSILMRKRLALLSKISAFSTFSQKTANFLWTVTQKRLYCGSEAQSAVGFTPWRLPAALQAYRTSLINTAENVELRKAFFKCGCKGSDKGCGTGWWIGQRNVLEIQRIEWAFSQKLHRFICPQSL